MNNKQTKSFKPSGRLNSIFLWPVGLGILLVLLDILLCLVSSVAASIVAVFIVIYAFVCAMMICYFRPRIIKEIVEFSSNYSQVQRQLLYELSIPYCLLDNKGNILWMNASMQASINRKNDLNKIFLQSYLSYQPMYSGILRISKKSGSHLMTGTTVLK